MSNATFNFRLDTLIEEIKMHPNMQELISLMGEQLADEAYVQYDSLLQQCDA
jgi:hypothetical protein